MGINTKSIQSFAVKTAFWLNVAVAAVYIASAYAGYADPRSCGYLSLLVLAFPIFSLRCCVSPSCGRSFADATCG